MKQLRLSLLAGRFAVCKLDADAKVEIPDETNFFSVTRTGDELSVVCEEASVPEGAKVEAGWRTFEVAGPMDFSLTGVVSSITVPLADANIPVFVVSTFDTDYLLVREDVLQEAAMVFSSAGHSVEGEVR